MQKRILALLGCLWQLSAFASDNAIAVRSVEKQSGAERPAVVKQGVPQSQQVIPSEQSQKQAAAPRRRPLDEARTENPDFWIFDAWVTFDIDADFDGYYSGFSLEFDADTIYSVADVYARLYLSRGDVYEEYHTSSVFAINGDSSQDSLIVESDLLSGFPSSDYDLLIELYDAYTDELVAIFDGYNDADLTLLPLESQNFEVVESTVIITEESGGSAAILMLLLMPLLLRRLGK